MRPERICILATILAAVFASPLSNFRRLNIGPVFSKYDLSEFTSTEIKQIRAEYREHVLERVASL